MTGPACLLLAAAAAAAPAPTPAPARAKRAPLVQAPLSVRTNGEAFALPLMSAFVLPGEVMPLEILTPPVGVGYAVTAKDGVLEKVSATRWKWRAPETAGVYAIEIDDRAREQKAEIKAFVMVPFTQVRHGRLNGYRIGDYPTPQGPAHAPPRGFVEVTSGNDETHVTPHFRLRQFLCKQESDFPKYVVLDDRLLLKLEKVLEAVKDAGHKVETLHVMSGYRTPFYNAAIDNVKYSQHQWGTAADVFIDIDDSGTMDDLDGNKQLDKDDARVLFDLVDGLDRRKEARFVGGLGAYGGTKAHGPFVHVDVRGRTARW
jgi:hypothetical protein